MPNIACNSRWPFQSDIRKLIGAWTKNSFCSFMNVAFIFFFSQIGFYKTAVEHVDHWQNDNTLSVRASVDTGPRDRQGAAPSPALLWSPAGPGRPSPAPGSGFSLPSWANLLQADWRRAAPWLRRLPRDHRSFVSRGRRPGTGGRARRAVRSPARRTPGRGDTCWARSPRGGGGAGAEARRPGAATGDPQRCPRPRWPPAPGRLCSASAAPRCRRARAAAGDELPAVRVSLRPPPGRPASRDHVRTRRRAATVRFPDVPRALAAPTRSPRPSRPRRSIHIVALGNEGDTFHQDNRPSGLIRTYLGRSPLVSGDESSLLLNAASTVARPVFTEYQASAFGNVKLVVHDCPVWVRGSGCAVPRPKEPVVWILPPLVSYFPDCLARGYVLFYFILVNSFGKSRPLFQFGGSGAALSQNTSAR